MNQRYLLTIAAVFLSVLGSPLEGRTQITKNNTLTSQASAVADVVKVGEYKTGKQNTTSETATRIYAHSVQGRQAATLYIRDIPVLTFLSSSPVSAAQTKVGTVDTTKKISSYSQKTGTLAKAVGLGNAKDVSKSSQFADNPVHRATLVAAKVNNLIRDNTDGSKITVSWKSGKDPSVNNKAQDKDAAVEKQLERYTIKISGKELVEINDTTKLADTTNNPAQDALQATNRLRRLISNAAPIKEIANLPQFPQEIASRVMLNFKGVASWYGYDWAGNKTANGERYNPEGMTAAHRTLPMGTRVRVTNTRNGKSVILRINDRGPYIGGRIIDVSLGAARILGMMNSGIAPVRIEVLGR
ncbi:MAG: septal ring lytic transglycosylase RlpA family protein [Nostocales cyanobacterium]|nr:MAG: septal ring lytic transglycosylase RlpA family protein [Nostocales cyanobacterium]TAF12307.1 MAG: septal ring lytic transglycosylase RlpA family protein [Nostocales cyanobacterium]